jgi:hypothetical protein
MHFFRGLHGSAAFYRGVLAEQRDEKLPVLTLTLQSVQLGRADRLQAGARIRMKRVGSRSDSRSVMGFKRGDHICAIYSTTDELTREVADFLAEGLRSRERCWYVGAGPEMDAIGAALQKLGIDTTLETRRGGLKLISGDGAYVVHGTFNPEGTIQVFNDAIEQAYTDGFTGFRAAAEMSWALDCEDGAHQVILYEALLKSLFAGCRAIGLCLYDRKRMPLGIINGALATHPVAGSHGHYGANPFYDPATTGIAPVHDADVLGRLEKLDRTRGLHRNHM